LAKEDSTPEGKTEEKSDVSIRLLLFMGLMMLVAAGGEVLFSFGEEFWIRKGTISITAAVSFLPKN